MKIPRKLTANRGLALRVKMFLSANSFHRWYPGNSYSWRLNSTFNSSLLAMGPALSWLHSFDLLHHSFCFRTRIPLEFGSVLIQNMRKKNENINNFCASKRRLLATLSLAFTRETTFLFTRVAWVRRCTVERKRNAVSKTRRVEY